MKQILEEYRGFKKEIQRGNGTQDVKVVNETYYRRRRLPSGCRLSDWHGLYEVGLGERRMSYFPTPIVVFAQNRSGLLHRVSLTASQYHLQAVLSVIFALIAGAIAKTV